MSENLKTYTFLQQLEQGNIRIPRIQRGYAQGRKTKKVEGIRKTFLHTLFQVIRSNRPSTELDFVYGSMKNGAFEPLDGQQRLTTLFLIHWMLGVNLTRKDNERRSVFTYASCPTSEDFSNALVSHDAIALIKDTLGKREKAVSKEDHDCKPSHLILKRDWFHWEWKFDPSISSMLVMIDGIFDEIVSDDNWFNNLESYRANLNNITFNGLNLGDFGLSNELFIKMNARGKQLSDFDKVKSTLEEEIQIQQSEYDADGHAMSTPQIESEWRRLMDGTWSDYFWHTYARDIITSSSDADSVERKQVSIKAAKNCEVVFKKLLLRLIQLQLHSMMPVSEKLRDACYKKNAVDLDNLLLEYGDSLLSFRNKDQKVVGQSETMIDFSELINQINSLLIVSDNGTVKDIFSQLPADTHINCNDIDLMQSFLQDSLANDVALTFFASLQFIRTYPYSEKEEWRDNFCRWIKSLRNILANDNNTQRIDKRWRYENAMKAIMDMAKDLSAFGTDNNISADDKNFVNGFFDSIKNKTYVGIDNQSLKEETDKAALVLSDESWQDVINAAEHDAYLWGQIRALIQWGADDIEMFRTYLTKLTQLLGAINQNPHKYYLASLKFDSYGWSTSNRLYQLNFDRDNSFKRYLRDFDKELGTNAPLLKRIIDKWISTANELPADMFLDSILSDETIKTPSWLNCIIKEPSILDYSYHKSIYEDNGHVIMAQLKTMDSHCFDPVLKYLQIIAGKEKKGNRVTFDDSKGNNRHSISYNSEKGVYSIQWSKDQYGMYSFSEQEKEPQLLNAEEAIAMFSNLLYLDDK